MNIRKMLALGSSALVALAPLGIAAPAAAQAGFAIVVSACATPPTTYQVGRAYQLTMDTTGTLCTVSGGGGGGGGVVTNAGTFAVQNTAATPAGTNVIGHIIVDTAPSTPITAAALPLPSGAATAAKQPALGTAGAASADVLTIQGVTSMTPLKTDGSGVTQPVSGTVTVSGSPMQQTGGSISQIASTPTTTTMQSAAVANGNGTVLAASGMSAAVLTVNCSACSGGTTINFEGTQDGTNYSALNAVQLGTTTIATTTTASGIALWEMPIGGLTSIRARISGYSAGTITVTGADVPVAYNAKVVKSQIDQTTPGTTNGVQTLTGSTTAVTGNVTAVQATGSNLHVVVDTAPTTAVTGTVTANAGSGTFNIQANASVNVAQVAGTTQLVNTGATGAGSPRVTVAVDSATVAGSASIPGGTNSIGTVQAPISPLGTNPSNTLTLPSTTTGYAAGALMCTNATVATCNTALASQFFTIPNAAGSTAISRIRLSINDNTSGAWGGATVQIDLWSAAPVFVTTGDRGLFSVDFSTGAANHLATFSCTYSANTTAGDGVWAECSPSAGSFALPKLASGSNIYWTSVASTATGTTGQSKVETLVAELAN